MQGTTTQNLVWMFFPTIVYADLETTIHNAVTTVWPGCEVKACRFNLEQSWWWKIQSLWLSKQCGKKDSEVSQFLKKIFELLLWPPTEVSDCFALECLSNLPNDKRMEQFCSYLLENYIDAHSTFGPNVLHHHWGQQTHVSNCMPTSTHYFTARIIIFLFLYLHCKKIQNETYIKMRSVTTRRFKKISYTQTRGLTSSKHGQYRVKLI